MENIFTNIYEKKSWVIYGTESVSGSGSGSEQTKTIIQELPKLFAKYNIKSVFDCPCGDFYWMRNCISNLDNYIGGDIVEDLIHINNNKYQQYKFIKFDITNDKIPDDIDLIFCRDVFVHFSYDDIKKAINNIKNSNCKYLLTTTFTKRNMNFNINTGAWRPINLDIEPFNFKNRIDLIDEKCTESHNNYTDKSLGLYLVSDLPSL
jgi:hypothetical protein